jgi:N-acetylglucosaminyldiphosphoundecaprenol N-acetyl-beta-D-mannosaminyltransferase
MTSMTTAIPSPRVTVTPQHTLLAGHELFRGDANALVLAFDRLIERGGRHLVVTPNVDQVLTLRKSEPARRALELASLRPVDGVPLLFLARLLGDRTLHRLTGSDILLAAAEAASSRGWRVVIAGGNESVSEIAAEKLRERFAGADLTSISFPHIPSVDDPRSLEVIDRLSELRPQVVFLSLGSPKQEAWYVQWQHQLPDAIYIGIGAAVDFVAGTKRRAPRFIQACGAEWIWRLAQEPRRLARRYLVEGPRFLSVIVSSALPGFRGRASARGNAAG